MTAAGESSREDEKAEVFGGKGRQSAIYVTPKVITPLHTGSGVGFYDPVIGEGFAAAPFRLVSL